MNHLTRQGARLPNTGEVRVNGKNVGRDMKHISAYVQQDDVFFGSLTVGEHLMFQVIIPAAKKIKLENIWNNTT